MSPPTAFDDALDEAMERGFVVAFRLLGQRDAARDAVQEATARALDARDRYDPSRPFYPWFYRILRNHCLDVLSQRKREAPLEPVVAADEPRTAPRAERALIADERQRAILDAVESMPDALREMIELRHFQDLSYAEMADVLDIPKGTVMSRLYRARKKLRDLLLKNPDFADRDGGRR